MKIRSSLFFIFLIIPVLSLSCGSSGDSFPGTISAGSILQGEVVWDEVPSIECMAVDSSDNIYLGGSAYNAAGSDTGLDWLLIKYNKQGKEQWRKSFDGNNGSDAIKALVVDGSDNVYAAGYGTDIDPGGASVSGKDWWIKEFDSDGNQIWDFKNDFVDKEDIANAAVIDHEGKIITGGYRTDSSDEEDYAVMKFNNDSTHTMPWTVKIFDKSSKDKIKALTIDSDNNIYAAGTYWYNENTDWWVLKINPDDGSSAGEATYGLTALGLSDYPNDIKITSNNTLLATGKAGSSTMSIGQEWVFKKYNSTLDTIGSDVLFGDTSAEGAEGTDTGFAVSVHSDDSFSILGTIKTDENNNTCMIKYFNSSGILTATYNIDSYSNTKVYKKMVYGSSGTAYIGGFSMTADDTHYNFSWIIKTYQ